MSSIFGALFVIAEIVVGEEKEEGRVGFIGIGAVFKTLCCPPDLLSQHVRSL